MRHLAFLCFLGLILAVAPTSPSRALERPGVPSGQFRDQLLEMKRARLGSALGVDQATVDRLIAIEQKYTTLKAQNGRDIKTAIMHLQQIMRNPQPPQEEVRALLNSILVKEQEMQTLRQQQYQEEMNVLTPVQQARYVFFLMNVRDEVRKEARSLRGTPGGPARTAPFTPGGPATREVVRPSP